MGGLSLKGNTMNDANLSDKSCAPCQGLVEALNESHKDILLAQLGSGWKFDTNGHLCIGYKFKNFKSAMEFANKIADIADREKHHPNLVIGWGLCGVEIWTHSINGLTENDFILAAKIDNAYSKL